LPEKSEKEIFILKLLKAAGIGCFIAAAAFIVIGVLLRFDSIHNHYAQYLVALEQLEQKVAALQTKWLIIIVIFLLYLLRALSAIYPFTIVFIISAMVFSPVESFLINILGMALTFAVRYYTGMEMGEGYWNKVLRRHPTVHSIVEANGRGNPVVLLALRVVPFCPLNTVSHLYGTFEFPFGKYMLISTAAVMPRLITYSFIGKNVYDPLSSSFIIPLIVLLIFTGCAIFFARTVLLVTLHMSRRNKRSAAAPAKPAEGQLPAESGRPES
jgi:uncharacterized membrane protein YdjX (TVP38/TMEM64 family)